MTKTLVSRHQYSDQRVRDQRLLTDTHRLRTTVIIVKTLYDGKTPTQNVLTAWERLGVTAK